MPRPGYPYDPGFDYRGFTLDEERDTPFLGTRAIAERLGRVSQQAVRDLMDAGRLPVLLGDQREHRRRSSPGWAVDGLARTRGVGPPAEEPPGPGRPDPGPDVKRLRTEVARLRAENSDMVLAWAAMREANRLLAEADEDREKAAAAIAEAERHQAAAATKSRQAAAAQEEAVAVFVMPSDPRGAAPP